MGGNPCNHCRPDSTILKGDRFTLPTVQQFEIMLGTFWGPIAGSHGPNENDMRKRTLGPLDTEIARQMGHIFVPFRE